MSVSTRGWLALCVAIVVGVLLFGRAALRDDAPGASFDASPSPARQLSQTTREYRDESSPAAASKESEPASAPVLRGRVIDAVTREPVPQFEVHVRVAGEEAQSKIFRTSAGRFEWHSVSRGGWTLAIQAPGYQRFEISRSRPWGSQEMILPLRIGSELRGRIYDEISGVGIAQASVRVRESHIGRFEGNWRSRERTLTHEDGSFVLTGLPQGRLILEISADGYASREIGAAVEDSPPLDIALSSGASISGRLMAADGVTPVAGSVGLFHLERGSGGMSQSDTGEFSYEHLSAGRYLVSGQAGNAIASRQIELAANGRVTDLILVLGAGSSIRGRVTGVESQDLERVGIVASHEISAGHLSFVSVDEEGRYVLRGVLPGAVRVAADFAGRQVSRRIEVPGDGDVTVDLHFAEGASLSGAIARGGRPLQGVAVELSPDADLGMSFRPTRTGADGEYFFRGLPPGKYRVLTDGYMSHSVQVSGDAVLDIDMPAAQLAVSILQEDGTPVVDADIQLRRAPSSGSSEFRLGRSDHFGHFAFVGLEPGEAVLSVYKPGYALHRERFSYHSPRTLRVQLSRESGVAVRVRQAGSDEAVRAGLTVLESSSEGATNKLRLILDDAGRAQLPTALIGSTLTFTAYEYLPTIVYAWKGQPLDLELQRDARRLEENEGTQ